ncbi:MAG: DUF4373 domain-containing protein [Acutalibacteraceae bacterium]|nr:DUF4373 domain-containing protein [Acutalibacteraceae bacterium]
MARPVKKGLYYFPLDVDFYDNYKIMDLLDEYGPLGVLVYEIIISKVYSNGYYLELSLDKLVTQLVRIIGNKWVRNKTLVLQVILYCADIGLFDKELLNQSVITSVGIQQRYSEVTVRNKVDMNKYWLIGSDNAQSASVAMPEKIVSVTETPVSAAKTPINEAKTPQKESKENKNKENESTVNENRENEKSACESQGTLKNHTYSDIILPTLDETAYCLSATQIDKLQQQYEDIDVINSLRRMKDYLYSHPKALRPLEAMENRVLIWLDSDTKITTEQNGTKMQSKLDSKIKRHARYGTHASNKQAESIINNMYPKSTADTTSTIYNHNTNINRNTDSTADASYDISMFDLFDIANM